jgi:hypothetical protein
MKRYKIDFNNGKVFEVEMNEGGDCFLNGSIASRSTLEMVGATITEIEEPRKEYWVRYGRGESVLAYLTKHNTVPSVHVVELREGESICPVGSVAVDREKLAKLWKGYKLGAWMGDTDTSYFEGFCKELGLE